MNTFTSLSEITIQTTSPNPTINEAVGSANPYTLQSLQLLQEVPRIFPSLSCVISALVALSHHHDISCYFLYRKQATSWIPFHNTTLRSAGKSQSPETALQSSCNNVMEDTPVNSCKSVLKSTWLSSWKAEWGLVSALISDSSGYSSVFIVRVDGSG